MHHRAYCDRYSFLLIGEKGIYMISVLHFPYAG